MLFVFAEARGSRPLAARRERQELLRLFEQEIYPKRRIVADFLTHGVTRERLQAQIQENGGYHIVHWSGHGHLNLLELAKPGGANDHLSGEELLDLFTNAGGFIPRLFFLSACHSGDILRVQDWNDFLAVAQGKEPGMKHGPDSHADIDLDGAARATPARPTRCSRAACRPWSPCAMPWATTMPASWPSSSTAPCWPTRSRRTLPRP